MPKSSPLPGTYIDKWGYSFIWTEQHLTHDQTDPLQQESDLLADETLERLQALKSLAASKSETGRPPESDLYEILKTNHTEDEVLHRFWNEVHVVPEWVNWDQLERAQAHFPRYALPHMIGFALQAFLAEASVRTRKPNSLWTRLIMAVGFITSCGGPCSHGWLLHFAAFEAAIEYISVVSTNNLRSFFDTARWRCPYCYRPCAVTSCLRSS